MELELELEFKELLAKRNISVEELIAQQPAVYQQWFAMYSATGPNSFLELVRNEMNKVRRQLKGKPVQRYQGRAAASEANINS